MDEVLFETRRHASRPYSSNYPPSQHLEEGDRRGLLSYLPFRGFTQLKEKLSWYRQPRRQRRSVSLFVSARGDYVAVASKNQITILQKDNDYQEPVGIFTCANSGTFTFGTWSESHALLGVADDTDTIYIIKPNGEEITRVTKRHLNVSSPIAGLIMLYDDFKNKSCLCTFTIFLSDGSFHNIEVSKDPSASISSAHSLKNERILRRLPQDLCCWDYHPQLSLFAGVTCAGDIQSTSDGSTGSCTVSLWQMETKLQVEPMFSTIFEGSYSLVKGHQGQLTSPKVLLSPQGSFVASLDMKGCLFTFKFDKEKRSLSEFSHGKSFNSGASAISSSRKEFLCDLVDFTWWSDSILAIAKRDGSITMVGLLDRVNVVENDLIFSMPLLERAQESTGLIFLLENTSSEQNSILSEAQQSSSFIEHVPKQRHSQFTDSEPEWSLVSLTEKSVPEIYEKLINRQRYQAALDFGNRHGLDKDEVLKSQWLSSVRGVHEINTILPTIRDQHFIISECVKKIGPTEDAVRALFSFGLRLTDCHRFYEAEESEHEEIWNFRLARLKLLQFKDRLETFLGINMGRFSMQEYGRFRDLPIDKAAVALAEGGKIGALNLLFKRHPYSLVPSMMDVLAAIPETIPVQSYGHLLPAISASSSIVIRDEDWVECEKMARYIHKFHGNLESNTQIMTEPMLSICMTFQWPSVSELSSWYKKRARDIDTLSGQLDNCKSLVDFAIGKGISDLQQFLDDIFYLQQLIYSDDDEDDMNFSMTLVAWEQLPDYEKFKLMLMGVKEDNVIPRLHKNAIPFMQKRFHLVTTNNLAQSETVDSFLVRWLKEIAAQNKLDMCLIIFEVGSNNLENYQFFKDEVEVIDCALQCIYLCTDTDRWNTMCTILSRLPQLQVIEANSIKQRLKLAEGHVEAGRLLSYYQIPKPISFFLDADLDEKGVKQILRLLLSKFIRSHPSRTDNDWANMWRDLQSLQEKAFPFLDLEYLFIEFCRGLLKAGKFSLARSYLRGTSSVSLATDKVENLIIQASREYFFSAPSLSCSEIWKAKECLNIIPNSRNVRAEADIIDAITDRLPNLGVNLLPMAFKQIKDPMEIIKLAITSQSGAYINVDELIEIAKLLGLSSQEEISIVQEAIAREAAFAGDVQLAFDLCLVLAKKGHGSAWDLCAALARSQALESMDSKSQKLLLGFALSHCDDESIGELLNEWKDLDMQDHCETLLTSTGIESSDLEQTSLNRISLFGRVDTFDDQEVLINKAKSLLCLSAGNSSSENVHDWESLLRENTKVASFAASQLPWLLELSEDTELGKKLTLGSVPFIHHVSLRERAVTTILSWLTRNGFAPKDNLIASLAKSIMEPPVSDEEDFIGCSVLLNLVDASHGVEIIEQELSARENYHEFSSLVNVGMMYGLLHNCGFECKNPSQRRELLLAKFQEKHKPLSSDECINVREAQSTFWNEWKAKLEQQKHVADESRELEKLFPGVETSRFISGDREYIQSVVFSLIESVKLEKKQILKDTLNLAQTYGLDRSEVLLYFMGTIVVSEAWGVDDIMEEISAFREKILALAGEAIKIISSVYPAIDGHDKQRLAFIYNFLCECYVHLAESKELSPAVDLDLVQTRAIELARFCDIAGKECSRVSFIKDLNFKNIAGLEGLNLACFNDEVCAHIDEYTVETLAIMVQNLVLFYGDTVPKGLLSSEYVYTYYVLSCLSILEGKAERETTFQSSKDLYILISEIEQIYDSCKKHIRFMEHTGIMDIVKRFFTVILLMNKSLRNFPYDVTGKDCLVKLTNFWLKLIKEMEELESLGVFLGRFCSECTATCLKVLLSLLIKGSLSPNQCWDTLVSYLGYGLECSVAVETFNFCRAMIFSGCEFEVVAHVFSDVVAQFPSEPKLITTTERHPSVNIQDLPNLYLSILEAVLQDMASGQSIHYLLSSLSKLEGDLEDLKKVRIAVWDRLSKFSHNLELPGHLRVYALELMQFISGRKRNNEGQVASHLLPWEGWDDSQDRETNLEKTSNDPMAVDYSSSRFTNTLLALKSTQLVSSISLDLEITPEDILSVESAVSCFLRLSESIASVTHVDTLLALLAEWEGLFTTGGIGEGNNSSAEASDAINSWSNDDWDDEGWENFQEPSIEKESNISDTLTIHPLHFCWFTVLKKLVTFSSHTDILKLLDQKNCGILLNENETRDLTETTLKVDCFLALKIALLLPYKEIQMLCMDAVEKHLQEVGISEDIVRDQFFIVLVLLSGVVSSIITQACYGATFSYLCFVIGNLCRKFQESTIRSDEKSLFAKLVFPCFVAELVKADQHVLAGFLITRFMHTNAVLSLINISEASLRRYLETQYQQLQEETESLSCDDASFCGVLLNSVTNLRGKLGSLIQTAISLLPTDVR